MTSATTLEPEVVQAKHPLILTGSGYGLEISPAYKAKKAELLKGAALIAQVNNAEDDAAAAAQIALLSAHRIEVEKSRVLVKAPALDFGKNVDSEAKTFTIETDSEETRLKKARGEYALVVEKERQRVLAEMEKSRQAEQERIRKEQAAAAKLEADRMAAEQAQWEADSPEDEAKAAKAVEDAKAAELKRLEESAKRAVDHANEVAFIPAAPKGVKMVADFEVTDLDALYHHNVSLVKMEARREEILKAIAGQTIGETLPTIPGLRVFMRPQVR